MDAQLKQLLLDTIRRALEPENVDPGANVSEILDNKKSLCDGDRKLNNNDKYLMSSARQASCHYANKQQDSYFDRSKESDSLKTRLPSLLPPVIPRLVYNPSAESTMAEDDEVSLSGMNSTAVRRLMMEDSGAANCTQTTEQFSLATIEYFKRHSLLP
jgi:hypothetical protein